MSGQLLIILALLLPLVGAVGITLCGRWPNLRESITLVTAAALGLIVINLYLRLQQGADLSLQVAEPLPGIPIQFTIEPLGMLFALVAGLVWFVCSIYAIGYRGGHSEK